jgi:hypothetical protein
MQKLYAVITEDAPGAAALRTEHLQAHLAHMQAVIGHFALAGPLKDESGVPTGSLLIVKATTAEVARALVEQDPYFAAGVWARLRVEAFTAAAGDWIGGTTW